ncbi:MAG TPA: endopeptidase La [Elusimicrobia bacterium]|nr:MAG: endopeptidase La [Elusimicrobia bacterium RIFOXYA12_FULL_49_49]OGS09703.1 MAG: endopeptidase La [Elusimicrobia bacterium RIFOXYB1_FULL_48_9]OGS15034.1 MAG: endopeptidase La [Elusimicrobia bacterium RIFOXYA2_FULL_47_53]OGS29372.1 MAG: endopeptidase La [Elusimicrobia bacterium RIFOXYB2_FULL_46_23]HBU69853.1 endopeptidase La [Elusimicrobiota bacterium]
MSELDRRQSGEKKDQIQNIPSKLPLLPVRDIVIFPAMVLPLAVGREKSIKALEEAMSSHRLIFLATQKNVQTEDPSPDDIHRIGTVSEVLQLLKMPDGTLKVLVEGIQRARWTDFRVSDKGYVEVELNILAETAEKTPETEALMRRSLSLFEQYVKLNTRLPMEIFVAVTNIVDPGRLADTIASHLMIKVADKQAILELPVPHERLEKLVEILNAEIEILNIERRIQNRVRSQIEKTQKEYYLTEQMKAIQKELKQKDDYAKELDELRVKIKEAKLPKEASEVADKELVRLEKMMPFSPEATVIRTYLDWLISLPWEVTTKDNLDLKRAQKILDEDHFGLEKPKDRVLEYLAVLKRVQKIKGPILCFIGPPGVGKTSIAKSVARSLGRNFVRISLGGVRDEAEVRGHRRTYIGALPGRIIQSLRKAKSNNPVFILDEIDKMGSDWRGDPSAALLEVLDPEQNYAFADHYLDVDFDLSKVMFITTANTLYNIPTTLLDRLEVIRFSGYTTDEKVQIAQKFLIPKQLKEHGLSENEIEIAADAIKAVINDYTHEAGVRNLDREMANLCRKVAKDLGMEENAKPRKIKITAQNVGEFLGVPRYSKDKIAPNDVGVATGLAWTEVGGETLTIEVNKMKGKGSMSLTGKLGDVMKESAQAALSYVRASAKKLKINEDIFKETDFHVHVPEGAVPKDGPSAGIAMATALASIASGRPLKKGLAMTGEVTLRGRVLSIGGLKEKVLAAYREGMKTVIFPDGNRKDLADIPKDIQKEIKLIPVKHMDDVIRLALEGKASKK